MKNSVFIEEAILSRNQLDSKHWSFRSKYSKNWEIWIWREYPRRPQKAQGKMSVKITSLRTRLLDQDNLSGGCKGILDALKRLELIVDDTPKWVEVKYEQRVVKEGRGTIIEVEDFKEGL